LTKLTAKSFLIKISKNP